MPSPSRVCAASIPGQDDGAVRPVVGGMERFGLWRRVRAFWVVEEDWSVRVAEGWVGSGGRGGESYPLLLGKKMKKINTKVQFDPLPSMLTSMLFDTRRSY